MKAYQVAVKDSGSNIVTCIRSPSFPFYENNDIGLNGLSVLALSSKYSIIEHLM